MKQSMKWTVAVLLALLLAFSMFMASCGGGGEESTTGEQTTVDPGPDGETETTEKPDEQTTADPTSKGEDPLSLQFGDSTATAEIVSEREILVSVSSNNLQIAGEGNFTVQIGDGEVQNSENGKLTIVNTAAPHGGMTLKIKVEKSMTLTFTLLFDPGTEGNPYVVSETEATNVTFTKGVFIKITKTGWYEISGDSITLTNYSASQDGKTYLTEGTHGVNTAAEGEVTVTVKSVAAPIGYAEDVPAPIETLGKAETLRFFAGIKAYYSFTAQETGVYTVERGTNGKSSNVFFTLSEDQYATRYGRVNENDEWKECEGGLTATVVLFKGQTVIVAVDYSLGENMVGDDEVSVIVSKGEAIKAEANPEEGNKAVLKKNGKVCYVLTADKDGVYKVNLGAGDTNKASRFATSLAPDTYYGTGYDASAAYLHLSAGEVVYIVVDSTSEAEGNIGLFVNHATSEPMPTDSFTSGTYEGSGLKVVINRENTNENQIFSFNGTSINTNYLSGEVTFTIATGDSSVTYTLTMAENKTDLLLSYEKDGAEEPVVVTLVRRESVTSVSVDKFSGVYVSDEGLDGTTELTIYENGTGRFGYTLMKANDGGFSYDAEWNELNWGAYQITIKTQNADGKVTAIWVTKKGADPVTFTLTDKEVVKLPTELPLTAGSTYTDGDYSLDIYSAYQMFNSCEISIVGFEKEQYVIYAGGTIYRLSLYKEANGEVSAVTLYDEDGDYLATLEVPTAAEIPYIIFDGDNVSYYVDDYNNCYFRVPQTGYYLLCGDEDANASVYPTVNENGNKLSTDFTSRKKLSREGIYVYLEKDAYLSADGSFTATYCGEEDPASADPYEMTQNPFDVSQYLVGTDVIYVKYTATASGKYEIGFNIEKMYFVIDGVEYGKKFENYSWEICTGGLTCVMTLEEGQSILVAMNRPYNNTDTVIFGVAEEGKLNDLFNGGSQSGDQLFTEEQQGEYTGSMGDEEVILKVDADTVDITYKYDADMDGKIDGEETISDIPLTFDGTYYTASIEIGGMEWDVSFYFDGSVIKFSYDGFDYYTLSKDGSGSSEQPGVDDFFTNDQKGTYENTNVTITINADGTIDYENSYGDTATGAIVTWNGRSYEFSYMWYGSPMPVSFFFDADGNIVVVDPSFDSEEMTLVKTGSSEQPSVSFTEEQLGTYKYDYVDEEWGDEIHYSLTLYADGTADVVMNYGSETYQAIGATVGMSEEGYYTVSYELWAGVDSTAFFYFDDNGDVSFMESQGADEYTLTKGESGSDQPIEPTPSISFTEEQADTYRYDYADEYGNETHYSLTLYTNGTADLVMDYGYDSFIEVLQAIVETDGETYTFKYEAWGWFSTASFAFDEDGNITFTEDDGYESVLMEKGGEPVVIPEELFTAEEQGYWVSDGEDNVYSFMVSRTGVQIFAPDAEDWFEPEDLRETLDGLSWIFTWDDKNVTFRFVTDDDGNSMISMVVGSDSLELYKYW